MRKYAIYYRVDANFREDRDLPRHEVFDPEFFRLVSVIEAKNADDAYMNMQGEMWSPMGEARFMIRRLGLRHTSMSIGDVLYDLFSGDMYQVMMSGWEKVKEG
jgi:hypothetical protein